MILIDRLIAGGIRFVFGQLANLADAELNDAGHLRDELLAAQMSLELGEIDEAAFAEIEARIMPQLRELRQRELDAADSEPMQIGGVEITVDAGVDEDAPRR
jgi:hypothetical protein